MQTKSTESKRKFLFIGAHPDDETQVSGTMALLSRADFDVFSYIVTPGRGGKPNSNEAEISDTEIVVRRKNESESFAEAIGMSTHVYDNRTLFLENNTEDILALVEYLRRIRPDVIVLQNSGDYHFEHINSHKLAMIACEIAARSMLLEYGPKIENIVLLEADGLNVLSNPSIFIDISKVQDTKRQAIQKAYGERLGGLAQVDEGLSMMRGGRVGVRHAEAYVLLNPSWYRMTAQAADTLRLMIDASNDKQ